MSGINFKKISVKNFLSVGNIPIELNLEDAGAYLFVGKNGAGKSTIIDAITYALFGKAYRKINKPKLVNAINKNNTMVELEFTTGSGYYLIRRGMKPEVFEIYCNGKLIDQESTSRDYQAELEKKILRMNYAAARQIVLLSKTSYKPFMELDPKERRLVIEDLLGIEILTSMSKLLSNKITETKKRFTLIQKDIDHTAEKIDIIKSNIARFVRNTEEMVSSKTSHRDKFISELNDALEQEQTLSMQLQEITVTYNELKVKYSKRRDSLIDIKSKIESRKNSTERDLKFFEHTTTCPTCAQEIDEGYRNKSIEERRSLLSDLEFALNEADARFDKLSNILELVQDSDSKKQSLTTKIASLKTTIASCRQSINALDKEIDELKAQNSSYDADHKLIQELQETKTNLQNEKRNILDQTELFKAAAFLLKDSGIKAQIIKNYIPVINKFINKYLAAMDFYVDFELDENFNETIKSRYRDDFSYHSFSEGEKFRIDLALMLTWRAIARMRNSCAASILFLDEIFDGSLDDTGIDDFLKLIDTLVSEGTAVFVISHKGDQLLDKFENVIRFEKVRNFTQMVEE